MKRYLSLNIAFILMGCFIFIQGCAVNAQIKDSSSVYNMPMIQNAPKIILADLNDNRADKVIIGRVGALDLKSKTSLNIILTNRIAEKLKESGFNVQKINLSKSMNKDEISYVMKSNSGDIFLSGSLDNFFIASFDAIMEKGKGTTTFNIRVFDRTGAPIFDKNYSGFAENWIGLTGQSGCEKLIEQSMQASVDEIFKDAEFLKLLSNIKTSK